MNTNNELIEKAWEILNADLDSTDMPAEILALKAAKSFTVGLSLILGNEEMIMNFDIFAHKKIDWDKVPKDAKIYVRNIPTQDYLPRYFAYYKNGKVYAYSRGCTSFSAETKETDGWRYAKLADEDV